MTALWTGCVSQGGYSYSAAPVTVRRAVLKGRPRYRMRDGRPSFDLALTMDLSDSEFNEWQTFWSGAAQRGGRPFWMRLMMDSAATYNLLPEAYEVSAKEPWNARMDQQGRWQVDLRVEVGWTFGLFGTLCDDIYGGPLGDLSVDVINANPIADLVIAVIYGGPLNGLSPDDIYGGPITNLAEDVLEGFLPVPVIEPCGEVLYG